MEDHTFTLMLEWMRSRFFGKYRGTVVDNDDTTKRGRIKVSVPAVLGDLEIWAMPCVPYAGDGVGFLSIPAPQAGVWVEFEAGDPSYPIWVGCFWAAGEAPDDAAPGIKTWVTPAARLRIDDDAVELLLRTDEDTTLIITDQLELNASDTTCTVSADSVESVNGSTKQTVAADGVTSDGGGTGKIEVTASSVSVNSGALEVM